MSETKPVSAPPPLLDKTQFERVVTTDDYNGSILESYKAVYARSTMMLFSQKTRSPLAALTLKADDVGCMSALTARPSPPGATEGYFQGMLSLPDQTFTLSISNLSDEGMINFNILHAPRTVSAEEPGPCFGINETTELDRNESYTIVADQRNGRQMILKGITTVDPSDATNGTLPFDSSNDLRSRIPVTVDESEVEGERGLYFYLSVVPDISCSALVKKFAEGTVWKVTTGFARSVRTEESVSSPGHSTSEIQPEPINPVPLPSPCPPVPVKPPSPEPVPTLYQQRLEKGECPTCGVKTHKIGRFGKRKALTVKDVCLYGRCLLCNPMVAPPYPVPVRPRPKPPSNPKPRRPVEPYERRLIINGRMYEGEELRSYCEKHGVCRLCGTTRVKKKKTTILSMSWTDIPIKLSPRGDIEIYKGYHISPTCYSLEEAKKELGELHPISYDRKHGLGRMARREMINGRIEESPDPGIAIDSGCQQTFMHGDEGREDFQQKQPRGTNFGPITTEEEPVYRGISERPSVAPALPPLEPIVVGRDIVVDTDDGSVISGITMDPALRADSFRYPRGLYDSQMVSLAEEKEEEKGEGEEMLPLSSWRVQRPEPSVCEDDFHPTTPTLQGDSAILSAIQELAEEVERLDVYQFLVKLDYHRAKTEVVRKGLSLMRELVFEIHQRHLEKQYVFPNDSWCKEIKSAMSNHDHDANIQEEGATTITFLCSISRKYKVDLIRNHNANEVIAALETHPSTEEACCIALECLTRKEGTDAEWSEEDASTTFEAIKTVLSDPSHSGTSYAVLALYNLTCHDFRQEFVNDHMLVIFVEAGVISALSALIQDDSVSEEVLEAALSLLQQFWVCFLEDGILGAESTLSSSLNALLMALVGAIYNFRSESLHTRMLELIGKIPIPSTADLTLWKQRLSDAVLTSMTSHTTIESVQHVGLIALCDLFGGPSRLEYVEDLGHAVEVIIYSLNNFQQNADLQAQGCLALAIICTSGDWCKETVIRKGGITAIASAFHSHVVSVDPSEDPGALEEFKIAASTALASLARSKAAVSELRDSNLLLDFQTILTRDDHFLYESSARTCAINLIAAFLVESDEVPDEAVVSNIAAKLLLQNLDEANAQMLLMILSDIRSQSPNVIDTIMTAGDGAGAIRILDLMEEYPENVSIQEAGRALLAAEFSSGEDFSIASVSLPPNKESTHSFVEPVAVGDTQAAELTYGEHVDVAHPRLTGHEYDYEHSSEPTVLGLSIWEGMKFRPLSISMEEDFAAQVED